MAHRLYFQVSLGFLTCFLAFAQVKAQTPAWKATGGLGMARTRHTATLLTDGRVLVVGGLTVASPCCQIANTAEVYDPATGQWRMTNPPNTSRYDHIAVQMANGKVLISGGASGTFGLVASTEIYDPLTEIWTIVGNLNVARDNSQAVLLHDGRVLITGGGAITLTGTAEVAEIYNPVTNLWTLAGTMKKGRVLHSIALLLDGKVIVAGGLADSFLRTSEIYDPATNTWTLTGDLTIPSANRSTTLLANGKVLITGGVNASESPVTVAELYDPVIGQWTATGSMTMPRVMHSLTLLPSGKVLAAGGTAGSSTLSSAELYDPANGQWELTAALSKARFRHTATLLSNGKVLVVGGRTLTEGTISSAEIFDSGETTITTVSAASFALGSIAPESIVAAFGSNLATNTQTAIGIPLPTELSGVSVRIKDSIGSEHLASLFFVSPTQINFQIPASTAIGAAAVTLNSGPIGILKITSVSPGIFSADASGGGLAAAVALRVKANGEQVYEPIGQFDPATNRFVALPIDVSNPSEQVFLLLYGTGFRHHSGLNNVKVTVNGASAEVLFAGAQGDFVGLDQCNVRLAPSLAGSGEISIMLTVDGKTSNTVKARIK